VIAVLPLLFLLAAPPEATTPRIVDVRAEGSAELQAVAEELVGQLAKPKRLVAFVRQAEALAGVGALDLELEPLPEERGVSPRVVVVVHMAPEATHIGSVGVVVDGKPLEDEAGWRLLRRIDADQGLESGAGRRQHPWLLGLDRQALVRWYQERGYASVRVEVKVESTHGLTRVVWQVTRGPQSLVAAVGTEGVPGPLRVAAQGVLNTEVGEPPAASVLASDERALSQLLCQAGHPRAQVLAQAIVGPPEPDGHLPVTVKFVVRPGPPVVTGPVQVAGRYVPRFILEALPLQEGDPFCPDALAEAQRKLRGFLQDTGVPDPRIVVEARTWLTPTGRRVQAVTFDIRQMADARVERIWFAGNEVTRPSIMRQLLAVAEGDLYRQTAVDESVQAMRRSGLFQRVDVDVVEGDSPEHVSLRFRVQERKVFQVDVVARSLSLFNMDLTALPDDMRDVEHGHAFRGGGQRLDLLGDTSGLGFRWRDDFLSRLLVARGALVLFKASNDAYDERWLNAEGGIGLKGVEGRLVGVVFGQAEWTTSEQAAAAGVPVLEGDAVTLAAGFDGRLDLTRRDDERIQFLGLEASTVVRAGTSVAGEALRWIDDTTRIRLHLPLWQNRRRQHGVLRLTARNRGVFGGKGALQGHQRLFATARGYANSSIGVTFPVAATEDAAATTVLLGGLHAIDGSVELRIPLPVGRRNAVAPFFDAAAVADEVRPLFEVADARTSAGLVLTFSLFDERIEGSVWGAWPLHEGAKAEYVGGNFGGSF